MKLAKLISLSYLLVCYIVLPVVGQSNGIQYWNTEDGLSNAWISQITQDKEGYIWLATQYGLNRFDGYEFKHYQFEPNNEQSLSSNWVYSMTQDSSGTIWTGAYIAGVDAFNPEKGTASYYPLWTKDSTRVSSIRIVDCDQQQTIWISSSLGLFAKKANQASFQQVFDQRVFDYQIGTSNDIFILTLNNIFFFDKNNYSTKEIYTFEKGAIRRIYLDHANNLWAFSNNRLLKIAQQGLSWQSETVQIDNFANSTYFYTSPIYEDQQKQLWIGGQDGISIVDAKRKEAKKILYSSIFPESNLEGKAISFFEDHHDNLWIGTTNGLVLKSTFSQRFDLPSPIPQLGNFTSVREIFQIGNALWLANQDGLFRIDLTQPQLPPQKVLSDKIFSLVLAQNGYLYAGSRQFYQINPQTLAVQQLDNGDFNGGTTWSMTEDKGGRIWIGRLNGLQRYDPATGQFDRFSNSNCPSIKAPPTQSLMVDSKGRLWGGSLTTGLYFLDSPEKVEKPEDAVFKQINYNESDKNSLSNRSALFITEGKDEMIWVATDAGLNRINPITFKVERFLKKDGLKDEKVMSLVVDDQGDIWGSTIGHGIFRLDLATKKFTFFDTNDGLTNNNYLLSAVYKNKEGLLFFGSENKIQIINPLLAKQINKPKISFLFTELDLANKDTDDSNFITLKSKKAIQLPPNYQAFTIQYSTLNYFQAQRTTYQYLLEGIHSDWQNNGNKRNLTFTGLSPGTYQLQVKASNPDLDFVQDTIVLNIIINPPWWRTWWAYVSYALLLGTGIYFGYQFQLNRQLDKAETQRLQELDTLKTRFYTNITHELRTPLTIILGMSNQLKTIAKKEIHQKANLINRNGQQLLDLINQLLDLSKLETGKLPIQLVHGDLMAYLNYLLESFHSLAAEKNIRLHFLTETEKLWMDYDAEKIKQITQNLVANAIKHTPENGDLYLQVRQIDNKLKLVFRDTGKGIRAQQLPHIFERFYQTDAQNYGSGIGLSLTKELIEILGGNIEVQSQLGKGSTFTILLPITKGPQVPLAKLPQQPDNQNQQLLPIDISNFQGSKEENAPLLLLVEDNEDVLYFLMDCLKTDYKLATAKNGAIGIEKATELIPDLIISDVMMPEKNGFEVCQVLKTNTKTNHIPIILLTAKADNPSKIEGLEHGADAYLYKPFNQAELNIRIKKLLELRQVLQQRYQSSDFWEQSKFPTTTPEDEFVIRVRKIVSDNLSITQFGIPQLCQKLGISRVHLHRKLKALTNQSTTQFINRIRLQKAKELLKTSKLNVSEVAYEVGFSDPAYFSRLYSETFGEAPSVTRN